MSGFFPSAASMASSRGNVHASPPSSPQQGSARGGRSQGFGAGGGGGSERQQNESSRGRSDRRNDDSYYERRRRGENDDGAPSPPPKPRYYEEESLITENPDWARKSSRQRRFTQTTLPSLHAREQLAREEIDYDETERDQVLGEMSERMNDMSGYVQNVVQRKEEDLKFMAEMFDEEGNPIPRYDEDGNPIPMHDEDGHSLDGWDRAVEDRRKTATVTIDTTKMAIKEGWLWKKGSGKGVLGRTNWTRRYFKFDMFSVVNIYYFRQEMPQCSEQHKDESKEMYQKRKKAHFNYQKQFARGYVRLMMASCEIPEHKRRHRNPNINPDWVFEVVIPNSRTFFLCAENQEDFDKWTQTIGYITTTIQKAREGMEGKRTVRAKYDEAKRDAALCLNAYGKGLFEAVAGVPAEFFVQGFDFEAGIPATRGGLRITAVLESRDLHYDIPARDNGDGTYSFTYTPTRVGTYELSIMLDDYDIAGSPFHPTVRPAPVSAPHCVADGTGLFCAVVGAVNRFNIHTRNAFNQIVVAKTVPFEVIVEPPLVLCNVDGSRLIDPSQWRAHDNGNGIYSVAYLVEPTPEMRSRLEKGEHFEGTIRVVLDDRIHTPSFPREIKNAPFHPVLAPSATGAALANAARHAAMLLGGQEYNDFISSFGSPGPSFISAIPQDPYASSAAPAVVMPSRPQRDEPQVEEDESSFYMKESPVRSTQSKHVAPPNSEKRRYDDSFASASSVRSSGESFQQQRRIPVGAQPLPGYLPVRSGGTPQQPSLQRSMMSENQDGSMLSPEQREALEAEREHLLRLRRELLEGKHLVDEQVGRMAAASRQQPASRSASTRFQDDQDNYPPPPTSRSAPVFRQPPQREPPRQPAGGSPAVSQGITLNAFDASVQALIQRSSGQLKRVFRHYSLNGISMRAFYKCLTDFDVTPTFASKKEVRESFLQASEGDDTVALDMSGFATALVYVALMALSKPMFASLYPTPASKVQVLLSMWGLGDAATLENVMQRERYSRAF